MTSECEWKVAGRFVGCVVPRLDAAMNIARCVEQNGPLGGLAHSARGEPAVLWRDIGLFLPGVAVLTIWWTVGFSVLVFLAGLRALPRDLFEAARLDGAGRWSSRCA